MTDMEFSKLTTKNQTVIPLMVRRRMGLKPGDLVGYRVKGRRALIEKVNMTGDRIDPFGSFKEWDSDEDEDFNKL